MVTTREKILNAVQPNKKEDKTIQEKEVANAQTVKQNESVSQQPAAQQPPVQQQVVQQPAMQQPNVQQPLENQTSQQQENKTITQQPISLTASPEDYSGVQDVKEKEEKPEKHVENLTELVDSLYQQSDEGKKKSEKTERAKEIINAIADSVSSLSNIYAASKGATPFKPTSLSAQQAARQQRMKDLETKRDLEYKQALLSARKGDLARRQHLEDIKSQREYNKEINSANAELKRELAKSKTKEDKEAARVRHENRMKEIKAQQQFRASEKAKDRATSLKAAETRSGKGEIIFSTPGEKPIKIPNNVWKGSMQSVFDKIINDPEFKDSVTPLQKIKIKEYTQKQKDDFVKQNWSKYASGRSAMRSISGESSDVGFKPNTSKKVESLFD